MSNLNAAVLPGLLALAFSACDQGNGGTSDVGSDPLPDTTHDPVDDPVTEPEPEAVEDPEPETPIDPAAPFAIMELFTSEG